MENKFRWIVCKQKRVCERKNNENKSKVSYRFRFHNSLHATCYTADLKADGEDTNCYFRASDETMSPLKTAQLACAPSLSLICSSLCYLCNCYCYQLFCWLCLLSQNSEHELASRSSMDHLYWIMRGDCNENVNRVDMIMRNRKEIRKFMSRKGST